MTAEEATKIIAAFLTVLDNYNKTKITLGIVECNCGQHGEIKFAIAENKEKLWLRCSKCQITYHE